MLVFFLREEWTKAARAADESWTVMGQFVTQIIGLGATIALAVVGTIVISFVVEKTVGFRLPEKQERAGLDSALHGESGYGLLNLN